MEKTVAVPTEGWTPRTNLGKLILEGKIKSLEEIFEKGYKIKESGIIDHLISNPKQEIIDVSLVQKQTDAGEKSRFRAIVAVGNEDGYVGIGIDKASQVRTAIEKATQTAKMNIIPVKRGCGSWECNCGKNHSLPFKVVGHSGSVRVKLIPGPRGLGLVAGDAAKIVLRLAGIQDCWTHSSGSTRKPVSFSLATLDALKNTYRALGSGGSYGQG